MATQDFTTKSDLNLRTGPSTGYGIKLVIPEGDTVSSVGIERDGWLRIKYKETRGYTSTAFLEEISSLEPQEESNSTGVLIVVLLILVMVWGFIWGCYRLVKKLFFRKNNEGNKRVVRTQVSSDHFSSPYSSSIKKNKSTYTKSHKMKDQLESKGGRSVDSYNIIDVNQSDEDRSIPNEDFVIDSAPYWKHFYVSSASDIEHGTTRQRLFYKYFKQEFLKENYLDLNGNTNYAFILLFDLRNSFYEHQDIKRLEEEYFRLIKIESKVANYSLSILLVNSKESEKAENLEFHHKLRDKWFQYERGYTDKHPNEGKVGYFYRHTNIFNKEETKLLNRVHFFRRKFSQIGDVHESITRSFILLITMINEDLGTVNDVLRPHIDVTYDAYTNMTNTEKKTRESYFELVRENIYDKIFEAIEYKYRNKYNYKWGHNEYRLFVGDLFESVWNQILPSLEPFLNRIEKSIPAPSSEVEIELSKLNKTRWKDQFNKNKEDFKTKGFSYFNEEVELLIVKNQLNPSLEQIPLEVAKFLAKEFPKQAIIYYARYYYYNSLSSFKLKPFPAKLKKASFFTEEFQQSFDEVLNRIKGGLGLEGLIQEVKSLMTKKRKTINLTDEDIQQAKDKHEGTVEILGSYLNDEKDENEKDESTIPQSEENNITQNSVYVEKIDLNEIQHAILQRIADHDFALSQKEVEEYAQSKNMFKNQLIDSINDACMETLDGEPLIEEEEDDYIIEESFYNEIRKA